MPVARNTWQPSLILKPASVVRRHLVAFAALLLQPHPPALAVGKIVFDAHGNGGADAREGIDHDADQRAVAQAHEPRNFAFRAVSQSDLLYDLDALDQPSGL